MVDSPSYRHQVVRIGFLADVHAGMHRQHGGAVVGGLNFRARLTVRTLAEQVAKLANHEHCDAIVVLGDLFDTVKPPPQLIHGIGSALVESEAPVFVLVGNHDLQSTHESDNACAVLSLGSYISVCETPSITSLSKDVSLLFVPFQPGNATEWLPGVVDKLLAERTDIKDSKKILCLHLGIWDSKTPAFLQGAHDAVSVDTLATLVATHDIDAVMAGNWHQRRSWKLTRPDGVVVPIVIAGTSCPVNFGDEDSDGALCVFTADSRKDSIDLSLVLAEVGPRWRTVMYNELANFSSVVLNNSSNFCWFVRCTVTSEQYPDALRLKAAIEQAYQSRVFVSLSIDSTAAKVQAKAAVAAARSEETFEQAAAAYVGGYPIRPPGTIQGVTAKLTAYRKQANG